MYTWWHANYCVPPLHQWSRKSAFNQTGTFLLVVLFHGYCVIIFECFLKKLKYVKIKERSNFKLNKLDRKRNSLFFPPWLVRIIFIWFANAFLRFYFVVSRLTRCPIHTALCHIKAKKLLSSVVSLEIVCLGFFFCCLVLSLRMRIGKSTK